MSRYDGGMLARVAARTPATIVVFPHFLDRGNG